MAGTGIARYFGEVDFQFCVALDGLPASRCVTVALQDSHENVQACFRGAPSSVREGSFAGTGNTGRKIDGQEEIR
jgi:hypothetical protein